MGHSGRRDESAKGASDSLAFSVLSVPGNLKTPMITIVDDDEFVRESTKSLVRSLGYNARAFASAEEFLDSSLDDISCLILDVQMKGLSGIELQQILIAQGRRTPIIFVTAFPDERTRHRAIAAGAIGFLSKPCSDEKLTKFLDLALANTIT
jgi:FixJ family two-component response regulator